MTHVELAQPPLLKCKLGPGTDTGGEGFGRRHLLLWDWMVSKFLAQKLGLLAYNPIREGCGPEEMALAVPFFPLTFKLSLSYYCDYLSPHLCHILLAQPCGNSMVQ